MVWLYCQIFFSLIYTLFALTKAVNSRSLCFNFRSDAISSLLNLYIVFSSQSQRTDNGTLLSLSYEFTNSKSILLNKFATSESEAGVSNVTVQNK